MSSKAIFAVVAAVIIVVAGVGVYFLLNDDKDDPNDVTFLIQDDEGVHFWLKGNGETTIDALENAFSAYEDGTFTKSSWGGVGELFGIGSIENLDGDWSYWVQYTWVDDDWKYNTLGMNSIMSADVEYMLIIYGKGIMDDTPLPEGLSTPSEANVWDGSTKGVVFAIESMTGLYFYINGEGKTVYDALKNADSKYGLDYVKNDTASGEGVFSMFGLEQYNDGGKWYWWSTNVINDDGDDWDFASTVIGALQSSENPQVCFKYTDGTYDLTAPVY